MCIRDRVRRVETIFETDETEIISYLQDTLRTHQPRADYKELLDLCLVFLGEISDPDTISFRYPGAMSHTQWMSKVIYSLKIFLFRDEFKLKASELQGLQEVCIFIIKVHVEAWMDAPNPTNAPYSDFQLLKTLLNYKTIDKRISEATLRKFCNHLWYLGSETIAFSFFDSTITNEVKEKMKSNVRVKMWEAIWMMIPQRKLKREKRNYVEDIVWLSQM